jgi:putative membrane protein
MFYNGYAFWGMDIIWWVIWMMLLVWIFATPYSVPGQRWRKYSPLDILQQRFSAGQISRSEYDAGKRIIKSDLQK